MQAGTRLDFYPAGMDSRAAWHANWAIQLGTVQAKYNIPGAAITQAAQDNDWMQYWVQARHDADNLKQQLTKYFNDISGNDPSLDTPAQPLFQLQGSPPVEVAPGIEDRARDIARQIKGHTAYAAADGELLGIIGATTGDAPDPTLEFELQTLAAFELEATFRKKGMDAARFEFRYKGGNWQSAATVINSPGSFAIAPQAANTAEQIEIRGVYLSGNAQVGGFSDAKPAFIAP